MQLASHALPRSGPLAGLALAGLGACAPEDEAAMRARLDTWFSLGDTLAYEARGGCTAGVFELVDIEIGSDLPVASSVPEMVININRLGHSALKARGQGPDAMMIEAANHARSVGMAMRRAGLEARACMDDRTQRAFRRVLTSDRGVLAFDQARGELIILDPDSGLLVVVRGEA